MFSGLKWLKIDYYWHKLLFFSVFFIKNGFLKKSYITK